MTPRFITHDGERYLCGDAGSLIVSCRTCGRDSFREPFDYFSREAARQETCPNGHGRKEPVKVDDLETIWRPIWAAEARQ
jgi:hypothetical protein